jgi:hypothetical protein
MPETLTRGFLLFLYFLLYTAVQSLLSLEGRRMMVSIKLNVYARLESVYWTFMQQVKTTTGFRYQKMMSFNLPSGIIDLNHLHLF